MRPQVFDHPRHQRLVVSALLWLLSGSVLLLTTLVPVRTELLGWTPAFWLVGAPFVLLLALEPGLPRQLLALTHPRRRRPPQAIWH
ncbi:hypothetical protein [Dyella subtropica]|uniref:hypothetical protein n=1 Tax=Dyella subtropica TaxID=2992127 RepID=UPI00225130C4|nr:hypothetical protein [Dyella subtropica]